VKKIFFAAAFLCGFCFSAAGENPPVFNWSLLYSGSWAESAMLHNRGDLRIGILPLNLVLRAQVIDRNPMNLDHDPPWGDLSRRANNAGGGLYHLPTGSRLVYGVLEERGLAARIRSPWIRAAPFAENRQPVMADLRTAISVTGQPQAHLYLSSPFLNLFPNTAVRAFAAAQSSLEDLNPDYAGGLDFRFNRGANFMLEGFYTGRTLAPRRGSAWFSDPPPLPGRDFQLYAGSAVFRNPFVTLSGDLAYSQTFAYGRGLYTSAGLRVNPPLPSALTDSLRAAAGGRYPARPLSISIAADEVSGKFVGRDGTSITNGFRCAARLEWRGARSSLMRVNTTLRSGGAGDAFNRSSSGVFYRFPAPAAAAEGFPLSVTRFSLTADRNASNELNIADSFRWSLGLSYRRPPGAVINPLGINFAGTLRFSSAAPDGVIPSPYPVFDAPWTFDSSVASAELSLPIFPFQLRLRYAYTVFADRDNRWEVVTNATVRFRQGRFSLQTTLPSDPEDWNFTLSWRIEKR